MAKLKVIAACGFGMSSSQMIKMKLEKSFKKLGIEADIYHTNVGDVKSQTNNYDVVFCSESLVGTVTGVKATVIGLRNLLSEKEMTLDCGQSMVKKNGKNSKCYSRKKKARGALPKRFSRS